MSLLPQILENIKSNDPDLKEFAIGQLKRMAEKKEVDLSELQSIINEQL